MPLKGTLSTMALPDLLQWLSTSAKTGRLVVTNGRYRKEILFRKGVIASSSSDDPRVFLGQFLLAQRRISEEQLRKAMESQRSTGVMLGKILVMVGALTEEELRKLLVLKAEESLFSLFLWEDGSFEFEDGDVDLKNLLPLQLKVEDVLLEGLRRYDELQVILKAFSPGDSVLRRTRKPVPARLAANADVKRLLEAVDGRRTLTDLCLELHASEFKVSRLAYELYRQGCLEAAGDAGGDGSATASGSAAGELINRAEALLADNKVDEAIGLLGQAVDLRPSDLALRRKLEDAEARFVERAYQHYMPPDRVPQLKRDMKDLTGESLTPQEVFLVSRINGSWSVKDIVTISPLREVEALRVLKQLRERGIIDLSAG